jgi:hypothetical protein
MAVHQAYHLHQQQAIIVNHQCRQHRQHRVTVSHQQYRQHRAIISHQHQQLQHMAVKLEVVCMHKISLIHNAPLDVNPGSVSQQCQLPKDNGPCAGYNPVFYFNTANLRCEQTVYGGCGGNANRFATSAECEAACVRAQGSHSRSLSLLLTAHYLYR